MTHIAPLVTVMLTSSLLSLTPAADASIICTNTKVLPSKQVQYTFVDQTSSPVRFYQSFWSAERALLSCVWSDDAAAVRDYMSRCQQRPNEFSDRPDERFDVGPMFAAKDPCVSVTSRGERTARSVGGSPPERSEVSTYEREKRSLIAPGTLWCGAGNKATSYSELGTYAETDSCCRDHDHCPDYIVSFRSKYGLFNKSFFTLSYCGCDDKFRECLRHAKDGASDAVGYAYFNLLKMNCFAFAHKNQCAQRNWYGACKETKMAKIAEVHPATEYVSLDATNTSTPTISNEIPESAGPASPVRPQSGNEVDNRISPQKRTLSLQDITGKQLSCDVYKDLDKCRDKILPQQKINGLHNQGDRTLYHCNCTARLFQTLAEQTQLTEVQTFLLGHVSQSCFLLRDCTADNVCNAVLVQVNLPLLDQSSSAAMEGQLHLQAVRLKVGDPNTGTAQKKDRAVRLYKMCLRMVKPKRSRKRM